MGLPTEVYTWFLSQGPVGIAMLLLLGAVVYLFKRWDKDREKLIDLGAKYSEQTVSVTKALELTNKGVDALADAMQTYKTLSDILREKAR